MCPQVLRVLGHWERIPARALNGVLHISAVIFISIILPPILILMPYPTQTPTKQTVNLSIETFVSTFQGCYKDGLNGTRDYRSLSGGILALWQPIILRQLNILTMFAVTVMLAVLKPYKSEIANHTGVCLPALLGAQATLYLFFYVSMKRVELAILSVIILLSIPHFVFYGVVIHQALAKFNFKAATRVYWRSRNRVLEEQALIN